MLALDPILLVVHDVGVVPGVMEHLLTTVHLTTQRLGHTVDEPQLALKVGDHRRDVREVGHSGEGRTALEVDQDEVELIGPVSERQCQHERAQHLRLTRTGGSHEQTVRSHAVLCRLLDVEDHWLALGSHGEGHAETLGAGALDPLGVWVEVSHVSQAQEP